MSLNLTKPHGRLPSDLSSYTFTRLHTGISFSGGLCIIKYKLRKQFTRFLLILSQNTSCLCCTDSMPSSNIHANFVQTRESVLCMTQRLCRLNPAVSASRINSFRESLRVVVLSSSASDVKGTCIQNLVTPSVETLPVHPATSTDVGS